MEVSRENFLMDIRAERLISTSLIKKPKNGLLSTFSPDLT